LETSFQLVRIVEYCVSAYTDRGTVFFQYVRFIPKSYFLLAKFDEFGGKVALDNGDRKVERL